MIHYTQNYQLPYADDDTPLVDLADVTAEVAAKVDAALTAGGVAPPNAADLVAVAGRVTTLEGEVDALQAPVVAVAPTLTGGAANVPGLATLRYFKQGNVVHLLSVLLLPAAGVAAGTALFTLPVGFRPAALTTFALPIDLGTSYTTRQFRVATNGAVSPQAAQPANTGGTYVFFDQCKWLAA